MCFAKWNSHTHLAGCCALQCAGDKMWERSTITFISWYDACEHQRYYWAWQNCTSSLYSLTYFKLLAGPHISNSLILQFVDRLHCFLKAHYHLLEVSALGNKVTVCSHLFGVNLLLAAFLCWYSFFHFAVQPGVAQKQINHLDTWLINLVSPWLSVKKRGHWVKEKKRTSASSYRTWQNERKLLVLILWKYMYVYLNPTFRSTDRPKKEHVR